MFQTDQALRLALPCGAVLAEHLRRVATARQESAVQGDEDGVVRLRAALVDYLAHHGSAADTLEGIMDWWLPAEHRTVDPRTVEQVLVSLVSDGEAAVSKLVDGKVLYRRANKSQG
jgi:hypothetical protein